MSTLIEIESHWLVAARRAIAEVIRLNSNEQFYAAAFHLFYADFTRILSPALAANSESFVKLYRNQSGSDWSTRWAPPEWKWDVIDSASEAMKPLYAKLSSELKGASRDQWDDVLDKHDQTLANVSLAITRIVWLRQDEFQGIVVSHDFVVAILEGQRDPKDYNRLVHASIEPSDLAALPDILFDVD